MIHKISLSGFGNVGRKFFIASESVAKSFEMKESAINCMTMQSSNFKSLVDVYKSMRRKYYSQSDLFNYKL